MARPWLGDKKKHCSLCDPEKVTEWLSDEIPEEFREDFRVFRCNNTKECHNQFMIVAAYHGDSWRPGDRERVEQLRDILFPGHDLRWQQDENPHHPHCHVKGTGRYHY